MKDLSEKTGQIGMVTISTANSNLNGSGALGQVYQAPQDAHISTVFIKATGDTTQGVVRLFMEDTSSNKTLIEELEIPGNEQSSVLPAYQVQVFMDLYLPQGYKLLASTENAESFNVIAVGHYWTYSSTEQQIVEQAVSGIASISTANGNLNGSGSTATVITGANNGTTIQDIDIKSIVSTAQGMVRLFVHDGSNTKLFWEEMIPAITQDSVTPTYYKSVWVEMAIPAGWSIKASTQVAQTFKVITTGKTFQYGPVS